MDIQFERIEGTVVDERPAIPQTAEEPEPAQQGDPLAKLRQTLCRLHRREERLRAN